MGKLGTQSRNTLPFSRILGIEKGDGSIDILIKLDEKCELAAQFYFKYAIFWPGVSTVASFLLPVLFVVLTHQPFNRDDLYMPYKLLYVRFTKLIDLYNDLTFLPFEFNVTQFAMESIHTNGILC